MKKYIKYIIPCIFIIITGFIVTYYSFFNNKVYVNLNDFTYSNDNNEYTDIKEYENLESFISDYENDKLDDIYITDFLFDGVSSVKSPDLDDFIESGSNDTSIKTLEIKVINVNTTGDIEFSGEVVGAMIGVDTNDVKGNINLILNNVNIDTDSKKAPAIYVYNKDKNYTGARVTIKTLSDTYNYIEGGKLKKVSLLASDELSNYSSYYKGSNLSNFEEYTSFYGIYNSDELDDILFAKVTADSDDLLDGDPYYFYKASGAISSDIDLYFEGEGYLSVISKNKEGVETKGNLSFIGGTGEYEINSYDDCLNTTTASSSNEKVRNSLLIDVGVLKAIVNDDADEGDAIDSNGTLTINGGNIYAYAHFSSQDSGLDSGSGTYITGGTVVSTGNMSDSINSDNNSIFVSFKDKVYAGSVLLFKDENDEILFAFETNKDITSFFYSSEDLKYESFKIYLCSDISGDNVNGVYSSVNSYEISDELSYNSVNNMFNSINNSSDLNSVLLIALILECLLLLLTIIVYYLTKKRN